MSLLLPSPIFLKFEFICGYFAQQYCLFEVICGYIALYIEVICDYLTINIEVICGYIALNVLITFPGMCQNELCGYYAHPLIYVMF